MKHIEQQLRPYREDMEYLLFVGVPAGLLMVLCAECMDFLHLF
ncbi:MAG: hypothetical protein R6X09_10960 [Bacteroidales bacterium]